ncbi:hypothetical protein BX616_010399 [Lobosporangium transversale]|nr:hypothetical protein BX616_010399 [Lobosporangium transversale]
MYYNPGQHHRVDDFTPVSTPPQSEELRLYTWKNATLGEIAFLVKQAIPDLLSEAGSDAQLVFRHIYLDQTKGIFVGKDVGSVRLDNPHLDSLANAPTQLEELVIKDDNDDHNDHVEHGERSGSSIAIAGVTAALSGKSASKEYEKTLNDFRFVIGDYLDIAITSPTPRFLSRNARKEQQPMRSAGGISNRGGPQRNSRSGQKHSRHGRGAGVEVGGERMNPLGDRFAGRLGGAFSTIGSSRNGHGQGFGRRSGQFGLDVQNEPSWKGRGRGR